jgi:F0F1-type ATP synthase membrane subunit a
MNLKAKLRGKGEGKTLKALILSMFVFIGAMNLMGGIWNYTSILCWTIADSTLAFSMAF